MTAAVNFDLEAIREALDGPEGEQKRIAEEGVRVVGMLLAKNRQYGSSATSPIRVFSRLEPLEGINVRLDDKLSRIKNGAADDDEDPILDMAGYLILRLVAERKAHSGD